MIKLINTVIAALLSGILGLTLYGVMPEAPASVSEDDVLPSAEQLPSVPETEPAPPAPPVTVDLDFLFPDPTPDLSPEQRTVLDELIAACTAGEHNQAAQHLRSWFEFYRDQDADISGYAYDGTGFFADYTGTALASDGPTRFYYGELEKGVPNGAGRRLVFVDYVGDVTEYFWLEGTWQNGILVGEAEIVTDMVPRISKTESRPRYHLTCTFDGSESEWISSANVDLAIADISWDTGDPQSLGDHITSFHVVDGKLNPDEWTRTEEYELIYHKRSSRNSQSGAAGYIRTFNFEEVFFQNPFPWNGAYRYAYQELFGLELV